MTKKIKFIREGTLWYADLPEYIESGGRKADCLMVAGADKWLDIISEWVPEIILEVSDEPFEDAEVMHMAKMEKQDGEYGATYKLTTYDGKDHSDKQLWLCPVTLFVFGKYPNSIYYKKIPQKIDNHLIWIDMFK